MSACVCGKSGSKLNWNECGQCGGTGQNVYKKYLHFFAVNARVQCPQLTCQQAEEVYALLLHMDERSAHYANELGKALSENLDLKEQLEEALASLERTLERCPECDKYGPFAYTDKNHMYLKCPHCLFDWAVTAPATKP